MTTDSGDPGGLASVEPRRDTSMPGGGPSSAALRRLFREGSRAHPGVSVGYAEFSHAVEHVVARRLARTPGGATPERIAEALALASGEGLFLAVACERGCAGAWERFVEVHAPLARAMARDHGAGAAEADEIAASVMADLCSPPPSGGARTRMGTYSGAGSLAAWLRAIVARRQVDQLRRRRDVSLDASAPDDKPAWIDAIADPSAGPAQLADADRIASAFAAALAKTWDRMTPRERTVLVLCFHQGMRQQEIARLLGVGKPRISRLVDACVNKIRADVTVALGRGDGTGGWDDSPELQSMLAGALESFLATRGDSSDQPGGGDGSST